MNLKNDSFNSISYSIHTTPFFLLIFDVVYKSDAVVKQYRISKTLCKSQINIVKSGLGLDCSNLCGGIVIPGNSFFSDFGFAF